MTATNIFHLFRTDSLNTYLRYKENHTNLRAAQLTLASLLAAVPIITILLGILGFTPALQEMRESLLTLLKTHLAPGTSDIILPYLIINSSNIIPSGIIFRINF